ncbi:hypothetical protein LguiB_017893 [Lonicera macranthoides]
MTDVENKCVTHSVYTLMSSSKPLGGVLLAVSKLVLICSAWELSWGKLLMRFMDLHFAKSSKAKSLHCHPYQCPIHYFPESSAFSALGGYGTNRLAGARQLFDVLPHLNSLVYYFLCLFIALAIFFESKEYNLKINMVGDHVNVRMESKRLSINKHINVFEHDVSIFLASINTQRGQTCIKQLPPGSPADVSTKHNLKSTWSSNSVSIVTGATETLR